MHSDNQGIGAAWIADKLAATRRYIIQVVGRVDRLAVVAAFGRNKPPARAKLSRWLTELSTLKRREAEILAEIEEVEERHRKGLERMPALPATIAPPKKESGLDAALCLLLWLWVILPASAKPQPKLSGRGLSDGPGL